MYAVVTIPLIRMLEDHFQWSQLWYADDSAAIGHLSQLRSWYDRLCLIGPYFGYYPQPQKSNLVIKAFMSDDAKHHFEDVGIKIVTSCQFLGGVIGDSAGTNDFITKKASEWEHYVKLLSSIAVDEPQAAFIALTKSLQNEWTYLQRVTSGCGSQFEVIESTLFSVFLPSLFGHVISHLTAFYFLFLRAWVASTSEFQHCLLRTIMTLLDVPLN